MKHKIGDEVIVTLRGTITATRDAHGESYEVTIPRTREWLERVVHADPAETRPATEPELIPRVSRDAADKS